MSSLDDPTWQSLTATSSIPFRPILNHHHRTWAHTHSFRPYLYVQPRNIPELQHTITLARTLHATLLLTGSGHSPSDLTTLPPQRSRTTSPDPQSRPHETWLINLDYLNNLTYHEPSAKRVTIEAGMRLYELITHLNSLGYSIPNLGSITSQSIAGAIATGTHGSSLRHGLLSENVVSIRMMLADGKSYHCDKHWNRELFEAALLGLGGLGVITHITFQAVDVYSLSWVQEVVKLENTLERWDKGLWTEKEYVRVWWFPYSRRTIVWRADKANDSDPPSPKTSPEKELLPKGFINTWLGHNIYQSLLYISTFIPCLTPFIERLIFRIEYGFTERVQSKATQKGEDALLLNCLFPQFVNEWAIPLSHGPEFISRFQAWLEHKPFPEHRIPISPVGVYVHAPIEVRVTNSSRKRVEESTPAGVRALLDPSVEDDGVGTLYINATIYRPYLRDVGGRERYYRAFEWLMKEFDGRPHWAKNFMVGGSELVAGGGDKLKEVVKHEGKVGERDDGGVRLDGGEVKRDVWEDMYGVGLRKWRLIRRKADPFGLFKNGWLERVVLAGEREGEAVDEFGHFELKPIPE